MTAANRIIQLARETTNQKRYAMLKGQFRKLLGQSVKTHSVMMSAMRTFERLAPSPLERKA